MTRGAIEYRAAKVSLVNGLSTVLSLAFQLVSVPVCLKYWGQETYGRWLALLSAFMVIRALDGGFVLYVGNKLNYLYHLNADALRTHLGSAAAGIAVIGGLQVMVCLATVLFDPLAHALGMPRSTGGSDDAAMGLLVLILSWVLSGSYLGIVHRLLIPAGMMYQAAWWAMAFQVAQFLAIMAAATMNLSLMRTSLLFAAAQLLIYVASAVYVRRALPEFTPWLRGFKVRVGLRDLGHSLLLTLSNLIQQGAMNGTVILIAALGSPAAVPVFTTIRTVANLWTAVTTVLTAPLLPDVVRLHAKGEAHKLAAINQAFWALIGAAVNLGVLLIFPLLPALYALWTRHAVPLDKSLLALLLAGVVVANAGALMALHLNGINSLRIVLAASMARAVLALAAGAVGFRWFGLSSFGVGLLAGELAATLMVARYFVSHELNARGASTNGRDFFPVLMGTGSVVLFLAGYAAGWWPVGLVWMAALVATAAAATWGWTMLDGELRRRMAGLATRWLPTG